MDFRRWTREGLKSEMEHAGFEVVESQSMGNAFASLALNINLTMKYHFRYGSSKMSLFPMILGLPLSLLLQLILNMAAIALGPLDQSDALHRHCGTWGKDNKGELSVRYSRSRGLEGFQRRGCLRPNA
jgi:hypothetical protein